MELSIKYLEMDLKGPPGTNAGRGDKGQQGEIGPKGQ